MPAVPTPGLAQPWRNRLSQAGPELLEHHHIKCIAKNEFLFGAAGELPPTECWPELWIAEDFQYEKAKELVEGFLAGSAEPGSAWSCPECGEAIEGQFNACWRCATERPM